LEEILCNDKHLEFVLKIKIIYIHRETWKYGWYSSSFKPPFFRGMHFDLVPNQQNHGFDYVTSCKMILANLALVSELLIGTPNGSFPQLSDLLIFRGFEKSFTPCMLHFAGWNKTAVKFISSFICKEKPI